MGYDWRIERGDIGVDINRNYRKWSEIFMEQEWGSEDPHMFSSNNLIYLLCILFNVVIFKRCYFPFSFWPQVNTLKYIWSSDVVIILSAVFIPNQTKILMDLQRIWTMKSDCKMNSTLYVCHVESVFSFPADLQISKIRICSFFFLFLLSFLLDRQLSSFLDQEQQ